MTQKKIQTIDGATLMSMPLEELRFIVDSIIPQGLHILSGQPKSGKSWLLLSLCLNVTLGEKFWNFETEKGTVLYLCLEDSLNRIQSRLFDIAEEVPSNLYFATMVDSLSNGLLNQIEAFIKEKPDTVLIVIDTLQKVRDNVAECYERKSLIITTNLEFTKWNEIFYDEKITAAIIDRIIHHSHLLDFTGRDSRRLMNSLIKLK